MIDKFLYRLASLRRRLGRRAADSTINIPPETIASVLSEFKIDPWFSYVCNDRADRWDVCMPCAWLKKHLSRHLPVLETGCGIGFNLIWLAENGFTGLNGFDTDENVIGAGKKLCAIARLKINLWVDDGLSPSRVPFQSTYSAIIALNWTIYIQGFSLKAFLEYYSLLLDKKGIMIFDMVDSAYTMVENNEYLTSDWEKPPHLRQPSEYRVRMDRSEIIEVIAATGFGLEKEFTVPQSVPKSVFIIRKRA